MNRVVGVEPDNQYVAQVAGFGEIFNMSEVQYIETTV
jgi:hypothetical protein